MGGGGDSGPSTSTTYTSSIPKELMPYASKVLGAADYLTSNQQFTAYPGQQVAGFNPLQTQAFTNIQQSQPSRYLDQAGALAGMAGTNQFTGANVNQYMSPYVNDVVAQQQQGAVRDYARQLPGMASNATRAGALGGSRSAIMEAEAQGNLQNQLSNIRATGLQNAYQNAQNQFNTANQNQLAAAGMLGNVGQQQYAQQQGINQALMGAGNLMQQQQQIGLNTAYQNFMNQQNYPYQQLSFMNQLLRGTPTQMSGQYNYASPPTAASQLAGLGLGAYGLSQAFGQMGGGSSSTTTKRAGGAIKGYREGGIVGFADGGGITSKAGAIGAEFDHIKKQNPGMAPNAQAAKVQQTIGGLPDSVDWRQAYDLYNYTKTHPAAPTPPPPDTVVVQMAKQIAHQADAKQAATMQQAQPPAQQGVAGLPTQNVGQNYTPSGITSEPQVQAAEGGGVADLQADNIGGAYASGGIVAFNGEDNDQDVEGDTPVWLANSDDYFRASQRQQQVRDQNYHSRLKGEPIQPIPSVPGYSASVLPTVLTKPVKPGESALQSTTAPTRPDMFNAAPYKQSTDMGSGIDKGAYFSAHDPEKMLRQGLKYEGDSSDGFESLGPVDDSRYAAQVAAETKGSGAGIRGVALPKLTASPKATEVDTSALETTPEQYFQQYRDYREKSGLNKAISDMSKFLDTEQADAAKEAKTDRALALAQYGFDIASTPGGLLRGIAAGGKGYTSAISAISKEQKATERSMAKTRLEMQQSLAKDDMNAWVAGHAAFREDAKSLATLTMQRDQLNQTAVANENANKIALYGHQVTGDYYNRLIASQQTKKNATLEKYESYYAAAADRYAQTGDPKDKAAMEHYRGVITTLTDPTATKQGSALTAAYKNDPAVKSAEDAYKMAMLMGDPDGIAQAQAQLESARAAVDARFSQFTQQLGSAPGTGLSSVGASAGGWSMVGVTPTGPGMR